MVERCGDRQRKFDGVEKWPFQMFIESLPIILQIALLLLACGLSRYMWSVNTSVARVVVSFTILGVLFYIGIVVVGTSSYECPFQTPASTSLRYLRDSGAIQKLVAGLSLADLISLIHTTRRNTKTTGEPVSVQHHFIHLRHLGRRPPGTRLSIPSCPRLHAITGDFSLLRHVWHPQSGHEGWTPSHHSTSSDRPSILQLKAEAGPRDSKIQAWSSTPNHRRRRAPPPNCIPKRPWATSTCTGPGKHSEAERGQCSLCLLGPSEHH